MAALALAACRPGETEVVVTIDTTFGVPCTIDTIVIEAAGLVEEIPVTDADLPGSFTLVTDEVRELAVTVTGMRAGEPFAIAEDTVAFAEHASLEMRVLLDRACVPGPCPAVGVGGFVELPARAERRACGEAAYAREETLFVVRDACDVANAVTIEELRDADELEVMSPLVPAMPFPFRFYGEPVTQFWVSDNGYVGFSEAPPDALVASGDPDTLGDPQGSFPVRGVLPFWDNLRAGPKGVCLAVTGEAPDRVLHITWRDACFRTKEPLCAPDEGTLTFTVSLEETTDHVYVGYHTMTGSTAVIDRAQGQSATIGITDDGDAACTADQCSADGLCTDGTPCGYTEVSSKMSRPELPTVGFVPR